MLGQTQPFKIWGWQEFLMLQSFLCQQGCIYLGLYDAENLCYPVFPRARKSSTSAAFLPPNPTPRSVPVLSPETAGHSSLKPAGRSSARPRTCWVRGHAWAPLCLRWSHSSLLRLRWSRPTLLHLLRLRWSQPALLLQSSLRNPSWPVGPFPPRKAEQPGQGHEGPRSMASWMTSSSTASWTPWSTLVATLISVPAPASRASTCIVRVMFGFCPSFHCVFSWPVPLWPSFP